MYINEPGDLREKEEAEALERSQFLIELKAKRGEEGELTTKADTRHQGPGMI